MYRYYYHFKFKIFTFTGTKKSTQVLRRTNKHFFYLGHDDSAIEDFKEAAALGKIN